MFSFVELSFVLAVGSGSVGFCYVLFCYVLAVGSCFIEVRSGKACCVMFCFGSYGGFSLVLLRYVTLRSVLAVMIRSIQFRYVWFCYVSFRWVRLC